MLTEILCREVQELADFLNTKSIKEVKVLRMGKDICQVGLEYRAHSWAGSQGRIGYAIFLDGGWEELPSGGWYSENGRVTKDENPVPLWQGFLVEGKVDRDKIESLSAIAIHEWDNFNNPTYEYSDWTIYLRPKRGEIVEEIEREVQKEVSKLRELVC